VKLYVASHSLEKAQEMRDLLLQRGHEVTSRWITEDSKFHLPGDAYTPDEREKIAVMDEADVRLAGDGVVVLSEESGRCVPGGKHVEAGIALGLGRPVYVVGHRENIFHWHPRVRVFGDAHQLLGYLARLEECSAAPPEGTQA